MATKTLKTATAVAAAAYGPRAQRFAYNIRGIFIATYGTAFHAGLIGKGMISDLVRGIAFTLLADQDEDMDRGGMIPSMEDAVGIVTNDLLSQIK